jgi:uncharacterized protein (TIGR03083 family)
MRSDAESPDLDVIWSEIDDQRLRTAAMLDELTDDQWEHPSLCEGWTVRHVAAHLTLQRQHLGDVLHLLVEHPRLLRSLGLNRMIHDSAVLQSALPTDEIIARIRAGIASRRHNSFVTPRETLTDSIIHAQDIAIPLGIELGMRPVAAVIAAERSWAIRSTWLGRVNRHLPIDGYRLAATDAEWSVGSGPEITGPIGALLLLITGRLVALDRLQGDGAAQLKMQTQPA